MQVWYAASQQLDHLGFQEVLLIENMSDNHNQQAQWWVEGLKHNYLGIANEIYLDGQLAHKRNHTYRGTSAERTRLAPCHQVVLYKGHKLTSNHCLLTSASRISQHTKKITFKEPRLTLSWEDTKQNSHTLTRCSKQNKFVTFLRSHLQRPITHT